MTVWGLEEGEGVLLSSLLVILRVPGLALFDVWWMERSQDMIPRSLELDDLVETGITLTLLLLSFTLLLLPLAELVQVYLHAISAGALGVAFLIATQFVEDEIKKSKEIPPPSYSLDDSAVITLLMDFLRRHVCPIACYITLTSIVTWCCDFTNPIFSRVFPSCYILPILLSMFGFSIPVLQWMTNVMSGFLVLSSTIFVGHQASKAFERFYQTWIVYNVMREEEGFLPLLILTVRRLVEPSVLLLYWVFLFSAQVWWDCFELEEKKYIIQWTPTLDRKSHTASNQESDWRIQTLVAMSEICQSPLVLISFCIVLMVLSCATLNLVKRFLALSGGQVGGGTPTMQAGLTEGMVAFVLGIQTGLTDIEMPARIGALSIILFVVTASLLQSCLDLTHPVLLSLPATNRRGLRHLPCLLVSLLLLTLPLLMVHGLLTKISSDLWTLVIISSCLVTAVQAGGSLLTYFLFVWDSNQSTPSPYVDDYVYYVKAATRTGELLLAVAVVACGFYESLSESRDWSLMNSLVLVIHCYFNIYSRISQGWASYLARRQTSLRLSELEEASQEELAQHRDVCSICYQDMTIGVVRTACRHYFHTHCLRRWLVVQDNCPMCTQPIVGRNDEHEHQEEAEEIELDEEQVAESEVERSDHEASDKEEVVENIQMEEGGVRQRTGGGIVVSAGGGEGRGVSHLFDGD